MICRQQYVWVLVLPCAHGPSRAASSNKLDKCGLFMLIFGRQRFLVVVTNHIMNFD